MTKKTLLGLISCTAVLLVFSSGLVGMPKAAAFNASDLIDDSVFDNTSTMSASQIDSSFLNSFSEDCISSNNHFTTPDPLGWSATSNSYAFGGNVTAGKAIYDAATHYSLNPQTLLTTMEKEQSLFTGGAGCYNSPNSAATVATSLTCTSGSATSTLCTHACQYGGGCLNIGLGYGCPTYCYASDEGFSNQLIRAAWTLRFGEERAYGNLTSYSGFDSGDQSIYYSGPMTQGYRQRSSTDTSTYYDGTYTTSDGTSVTITNGATAALYSYTPFVSGNKSFDNIFQQYFGGIYAAPYSASMYAQSGFPTLNPGQSTTVYFEYQNQGSYAWYDSSSIGTAIAGTNPVHLATSNPFSRSSVFSGTGWANPTRPAVNFAAVYDSDGTTLASDQHIALPGQIAEFSFTLTAPSNLTAGTYQEFFQPVAEGTATGDFNNPGTYLDVTVASNPSIAFQAQSAFPTIVPSGKQQVSLSFTNTGNIPFYDDDSISQAPAGSYPLHLATDCTLNSASDFSGDWPSNNRPAEVFAAVYDSDGTTLAPNQHVAQPGQIVKFSFDLSIPSGYTAGTYKSCFQPVLERTPTGYFPDLGVYLNVTVPSTAVTEFTNTPTTGSVVSGEPESLAVTIKNLGNATLPSNATITTDNSAFEDPSWTSPTSVATIPESIAPGSSSAAIPLTLLAPIETSTTSTPINFSTSLPSGSSASLTSDPFIVTSNISPADYQASLASQSSSPTFSYGQTATISFSYKNNGNVPWRDDIGMTGQDTRNTDPFHLATANPINRASGFATAPWVNAARPAVDFSTVYDSDGTTLAPNQHVAQPGQIVKFSFPASPQGWVQPGVYREYFQPIAEGISNGATNFVGSYLDFTVPNLTYQASFVSQSSFPTVQPSQSASVFIRYQNTGTATWYDNTSLPAGMDPVHLATTNPINRSSSFSSGWPSSGRPDNTFSTVYNSDGTTVATNQHTVTPGQIVEFDFNLTAPSTISPGVYQEYFQPVHEAAANWNMGGVAWLDLTVN